jgi:glutamate synthase (NADPH) small chain
MSLKDPLHFLNVGRQMPKEFPVPVRVQGYGEIYAPYEQDAAVSQAGRCLDCGVPYCQNHCPLQNKIPDWLKLVEAGQLREAVALAHSTNPLPEICGRVCPQDRLCEGSCTLEEDFGAVTIGAIEKHLTDTAFAEGWLPDLSKVVETTRRVAIIGAGPAGLAAADGLRRAGIGVDVFDRNQDIGGLLSYGIPPFKLEKEVVRKRRTVLEHMGVRFHLRVNIGTDKTIDSVLAEYDAVFLALGTYGARDGQLPGLSHVGVYPALRLLIGNVQRLLGEQTTEEVINLKNKHVLVLGGGDTGMDCNRTAIRQGAASVTCVYRRTEKSMPGSKREVKNCKDEGVQFVFQQQPTAILSNPDGTVRAVQLKSSADGGVSELPCDAVVLAFGYDPDPPAWISALGIALLPDGRLQVGHDRRYPQRTTHPKIFAGGDMTRGADLVVRAVLDGREAAKQITAQLAAHAQPHFSIPTYMAIESA